MTDRLALTENPPQTLRDRFITYFIMNFNRTTKKIDPWHEGMGTCTFANGPLGVNGNRGGVINWLARYINVDIRPT